MRLDAATLPPTGWGDPGDPAFAFRRLELPGDIALLHAWFQMERAAFWGMQGLSCAQTQAFYEDLLRGGHATACIGLFESAPAFLVECYDPAFDELASHYPVEAGDVGMHFFTGPPQRRLPGFTHRVLRSILRLLFERLHARRVVVEPDERNTAVHRLNRDVGFTVERTLSLRRKRAQLAFCTHAQFVFANAKEPIA